MSQLIKAFLKETAALCQNCGEITPMTPGDKDFVASTANDSCLMDQTATPDAPGSEDMSPKAMHMEGLSPVVTPTEGTPIAPINEVNDEDLSIFDEPIEDFSEFDLVKQRLMERRKAALAQLDGDLPDPPFVHGPPDSWWRGKDRDRIFEAKTQAEAQQLAERYLQEWYHFTPEEFQMIAADALSNNTSYVEELLQVAASEGGIYRDREIPDEEEQETERQANIVAFTKKLAQQAGQPMQNMGTQPPQGVSNMTGGSVGSTGTAPKPAGPKPAGTTNTQQGAPGTQSPTAGGTTGTTPSSAPMTKGYGNLTNTANAEELDILPEEDEMLLSEFDKYDV